MKKSIFLSAALCITAAAIAQTSGNTRPVTVSPVPPATHTTSKAATANPAPTKQAVPKPKPKPKPNPNDPPVHVNRPMI